MPDQDFPLLECVATAARLATLGCEVHQKWTCGFCGSRQTMSEANIFYTSGKCEECNKITNVINCNYLVMGELETVLKAMLQQ